MLSSSGPKIPLHLRKTQDSTSKGDPASANTLPARPMGLSLPSYTKRHWMVGGYQQRGSCNKHPSQEGLSIPHSSGLGSTCFPHQAWESFSHQETSREGARGGELARGRIPTTISSQAQKYSLPLRAETFSSPPRSTRKPCLKNFLLGPQAESVGTTGSPTYSSYTKPKKNTTKALKLNYLWNYSTLKSRTCELNINRVNAY